MFSLYASTFVLVMVGFDRLQAIRRPIRHVNSANSLFNSKVVFAWGLAAVLSLPQVSKKTVFTFCFEMQLTGVGLLFCTVPVGDIQSPQGTFQGGFLPVRDVRGLQLPMTRAGVHHLHPDHPLSHTSHCYYLDLFNHLHHTTQ